MDRARHTRRSAGGYLTAGLVALVGGVGHLAAPAAPLRAQATDPQVTITEYPLPTPGAAPFGIALGPDGAVWFAELSGRQVGRISAAGAITEYPIPSGNGSRFVAAGPDGAIWFTSGAGNRIGRVAPDGRVTEYPLPAEGSDPNGITAGPDGALWFTEQAGNRIGRMTVDGRLTEYPLPAGTDPAGIAVGPDGAIWFAGYSGDLIGRMTLAGELAAVYPLPAPESLPLRLTVGPDGALWFTQQWGNRIGRITVDGRLTEYPLPSAPTVRKPGDPTGTLATSIPVGIAAGPDGAVWFTQGSTNRIGRITPAGQITEYAVPTAVSVPSGGYGPLTTSNPVALITGADGALWFTQLDGNRIGRLELRPTPPGPGGLGLPRTGSAGDALP